MINTNIYIIWILFYNPLILYSVDVILDPNTAHPHLILSEDRKKVRCGDRHQPVPNNPEHFNFMVCVLGQEAITHGRHYWEVEVGTKTDWDSINRKGKIIVNPSKGYWFLSLRNKTNYTFGTDLSLTLPLNLKPKKIGLFVDYERFLPIMWKLTCTSTHSQTHYLRPSTNYSALALTSQARMMQHLLLHLFCFLSDRYGG